MFKNIFKKQTQTQKQQYDKTKQKPIIRASICTGEKVAGFKDLATGQFSEIMLIRDDSDLYEFIQSYGVERDEIVKEY